MWQYSRFLSTSSYIDQLVVHPPSKIVSHPKIKKLPWHLPVHLSSENTFGMCMQNYYLETSFNIIHTIVESTIICILVHRQVEEDVSVDQENIYMTKFQNVIGVETCNRRERQRERKHKEDQVSIGRQPWSSTEQKATHTKR